MALVSFPEAIDLIIMTLGVGFIFMDMIKRPQVHAPDHDPLLHYKASSFDWQNLWFAIMMCKLTKTPPSYLLHPLDLIGGDDVPQLSFFPGMNIKSEKKLEVFETAITMLKKHFELLPMSKFSENFSNKLKEIEPK